MTWVQVKDIDDLDIIGNYWQASRLPWAQAENSDNLDIIGKLLSG